MKKTILSMLFLLAGIGCFAQKSGIIIGVTDGHLGKYSGYAYMSTGTANNSSYPETRWTPGVGFNLGYQFGFDLPTVSGLMLPYWEKSFREKQSLLI